MRAHLRGRTYLRGGNLLRGRGVRLRRGVRPGIPAMSRLQLSDGTDQLLLLPGSGRLCVRRELLLQPNNVLSHQRRLSRRKPLYGRRLLWWEQVYRAMPRGTGHRSTGPWQRRPDGRRHIGGIACARHTRGNRSPDGGPRDPYRRRTTLTPEPGPLGGMPLEMNIVPLQPDSTRTGFNDGQHSGSPGA